MKEKGGEGGRGGREEREGGEEVREGRKGGREEREASHEITLLELRDSVIRSDMKTVWILYEFVHLMNSTKLIPLARAGVTIHENKNGGSFFTVCAFRS